MVSQKDIRIKTKKIVISYLSGVTHSDEKTLLKIMSDYNQYQARTNQRLLKDMMISDEVIYKEDQEIYCLK